ncbi:TetR/AcrR family transcriptional regulator [Nocardia sp. NPDC046763]|uniref:TetR/AcrR family transcriptional regulator n=1 Tax=Nocardia sp. NPDC046763 TaxID=3155256 RepID=UPI0033CC07F9
METETLGRSARKQQAILTAAGAVFLDKGYDGASMDEVATRAAVSKQTVYKHFTDKDRLFRETVLATTDRIDAMIDLVAGSLTDTEDVERDLSELARRFLAALMAPDVLATRRMVIASANRFPDLGRDWYDRGFGRVLETLTASFARLAARGHLRADDPAAAAEHFVGLLLWIPVNKAMFTGTHAPFTDTELDRRATEATHAFLHGYGTPDQ